MLVVITCTPLVSWWGDKLARPWTTAQGDVLVVLGSEGPTGEDIIGPDTYWRTNYAVRAFRKGHFRKVILSGGSLGDRHAVSVSMQTFMESQGVPAEVIALETNSVSTRTNALETAKLLRGDEGAIMLLTSDYHMFRAQRTFRKAGISVIPHPVPDVIMRYLSWKDRWPAFIDLAEETVKIAYYYAHGWI
jgi:uncharacterized SAM-binding protein YcdF (DUF218 family)